MKKISKCLVLFSFVFAMTACLDETGETIVLPSGTVSSDVIPDELRGVIEKYIPIYEGNSMPNISGFYLADDVTAVYCSDEGNGGYEPGHKFIDYYYYFGPQNSNGVIYDFSAKEGKSISTSKLIQVTGDGSNFTAFYVTETNIDINDDGVNETWTKVSTVVSGRVTSEGFRDYKRAIIMVDKTDPYDKYMKVNVYRVFYEPDGLVERISDWRSGSNAPAKMPKASEEAASESMSNNIQ